MTAINVIRRNDGVIFLTDTASYRRDGVVKQFSSKVLMMPLIPAVLAFRGSNLVAENMVPIVTGGLSDYDELLEFLPISAKVAVENAMPISQFGINGGKAEIVVGGWSKARNRAETHVLFTYEGAKVGTADGTLMDVEPYTIVEAPPVMGTQPPQDLADEFGLPHFDAAEVFDPIVHGIPLMQAQRRFKGELEFYAVGGSIQMTTVYPSGIDSRVIHTWPDKADQPITPR